MLTFGVAAVLTLVVLARVIEATGNTITSPDTAGYVGFWASVALDASGNPVVSYYDATNANLKVLHCGNPSCTAGNTISSPDTTDNVGLWTSVTVDAAGNPVVAYTVYDIVGTLKILHCGNPSCTAGNTIASPDPLAEVVLGTSIVLDGAGNPVVSYYDDLNDDLTVLHCGNPDCTTGNTIDVPDALGFAGAYSSLALDADGNPVISYNRTLDLSILHCGNPACSAGNTRVSPDTEGLVGDYTSLALDAKGNAVVSYYDRTNGDLKVLHCGNAACDADNSIVSPDTAGDVGQFTSLALDTNGNPIISYYDVDGQDLKLLYCGNPNCTSGNSITTPDAAGDVGAFASLALNAAGNPVVSYYAGPSGDLKLLACSDPSCAGVKLTPTPMFTPTPTPCLDFDGDTICDGADPDDDNDGCTDVQELGTNPALGGLRDPHYFWDFYDVYAGDPHARDQAINIGDIGAVVARFGSFQEPPPTKEEALAQAVTLPPPAPAYHTALDRGGPIPGQNLWNLQPPDGAINIIDIGAVVAQFGHSCA